MNQLPAPPPPRRNPTHHLRRQAAILTLSMALLGWLGYVLGHPLHPTNNPWSKLASRIILVPLQWVQGQVVRPERVLTIALDSSAWRVVNNAQFMALEHGIHPDATPQWVQAVVQADEEPPQPARLRLSGDRPTDWRDAKWALHVQLAPDALPTWALRAFDLRSPAVGDAQAEWLLHHLVRSEGLLARQCELAAVNINGDDRGICRIAEGLGPDFLLARGQQGLVVRFAPEQPLATAAIVPYDATISAPVAGLGKTFARAQLLLADIRASRVPLHLGLDIQAAGRLYAICDLLGATAATTPAQLAFAYDQRADRLTVLLADVDAGGRTQQTFLLPPALPPPPDQWQWQQLFRNHPGFRQAYQTELYHLLQPGWLEQTLQNLDPELTRHRRQLFRDDPTYNFQALLDNLEHNRTVLTAYLNRLDMLSAR